MKKGDLILYAVCLSLIGLSVWSVFFVMERNNPNPNYKNIEDYVAKKTSRIKHVIRRNEGSLKPIRKEIAFYEKRLAKLTKMLAQATTQHLKDSLKRDIEIAEIKITDLKKQIDDHTATQIILRNKAELEKFKKSVK